MTPARACRSWALLKVDDIDFDQNVANVIGKGRRGHAGPFGANMAEALRRYKRPPL